jgi:SAM-dependent methyltransferase
LSQLETSPDSATADGFAVYFRTIGGGSRYTPEQFRSFFAPVNPATLAGESVIELGFGHGSFLHHVLRSNPARLSGVDLGDLVGETQRKLERLVPQTELDLRQGDLTRVDLGPHDFAYCIGVLHHLREPEAGFASLLRHTRPGGRFHGWVYSREGNFVVRRVADPVRRASARLPWWLTKWGPGFTVAAVLFGYARLLAFLQARGARAFVRALPLHDYASTIAGRDFAFFHFLATDFLVARHTVYLDRPTVESWLRHPDVEPGSTYLIHRNGNSWTFGGRRRRVGSESKEASGC